MADSKAPFTGTITSVEHIKTSAKGWAKYDVKFQGESDARKMDVPPDANYTPKVGDTIKIWEGKFNTWTIDKNSIPTAAASTQGSNSGSSNEGSTGGGGHNPNFRDPKVIEVQENFKVVASIYVAAFEGLDNDNRPTTIDEIDAVVDQAWAKAKSLSA